MEHVPKLAACRHQVASTKTGVLLTLENLTAKCEIHATIIPTGL